MVKRGKAEKWKARSERLSAALRQNLKRRKEQARGRDAGSKALGDRAGQDPHAAKLQEQRGEADLPAPDTATEPAAPDFRRNPGGNSPAARSDGTKTEDGG